MSASDEKSFDGKGELAQPEVQDAAVEIDPAVERRVRRKLDMTVLPAFAIIFG